MVELGFCLLSADVISADRLEVMPSGSRDQNAVDGLGDEDAEVTGWSEEGYSWTPDYNIYWGANVSGGQYAVDLIGEEAEVTV